jgi:hypothetical protein
MTESDPVLPSGVEMVPSSRGTVSRTLGGVGAAPISSVHMVDRWCARWPFGRRNEVPALELNGFADFALGSAELVDGRILTDQEFGSVLYPFRIKLAPKKLHEWLCGRNVRRTSDAVDHQQGGVFRSD